MSKTCPSVTLTTMRRIINFKPEIEKKADDLRNCSILRSTTLRENKFKNNVKCKKTNSALEFYTLVYNVLSSRNADLLKSIRSPRLLKQRVEEAINLPEDCLKSSLPWNVWLVIAHKNKLKRLAIEMK